MKIQTRVLKEIFETGRPMTVDELCKNLNLTRKQVYMALMRLEQRGLIKIKRQYGFPKVIIVGVDINENLITKIKRVIKMGEEENGD